MAAAIAGDGEAFHTSGEPMIHVVMGAIVIAALLVTEIIVELRRYS